MIKANIDYFNGKGVIEASGTAKEIIADTMALVQSIHRALPDKHGRIYKKILRDAVNQDGGPLWKLDEDDAASEAKAAVADLLKRIDGGRYA